MSEDILEDVSCPACGAHFKVRQDKLGLKGRCKCGHSFTLRSQATSGHKDDLCDDDILAALPEGPPVSARPSPVQPSWQAPAVQEPAPHPPSPAHMKQRSAVSNAAIERTSETGRPIPRYRALKAIGVAFRVFGIVASVLGVVLLVMALFLIYNRPSDAATLAVATASGLHAGITLVCAIMLLGFAEAILAFRDLVINSWMVLER